MLVSTLSIVKTFGESIQVMFSLFGLCLQVGSSYYLAFVCRRILLFVWPLFAVLRIIWPLSAAGLLVGFGVGLDLFVGNLPLCLIIWSLFAVLTHY